MLRETARHRGHGNHYRISRTPGVIPGHPQLRKQKEMEGGEECCLARSTLQPGDHPQELPPSAGFTPSLPCGSEMWALQRGKRCCGCAHSALSLRVANGGETAHSPVPALMVSGSPCSLSTHCPAQKGDMAPAGCPHRPAAPREALSPSVHSPAPLWTFVPILTGFRPSVAISGRAHCPSLGCGSTLSE